MIILHNISTAEVYTSRLYYALYDIKRESHFPQRTHTHDIIIPTEHERRLQ